MLLYAVSSTAQTGLLGLYAEEAFHILGSLQLLHGRPVCDHIVSAPFLSIDWPLTVGIYHGALESYLALPFLKLFGVNAVSLRLMPIFFGVLALISSFVFVKEFLNKRIAFIFIALLATHLSFVMGSRIELSVTTMTAAAMTALLCFSRCRRDRSPSYFYLGMFCLGLGLNLRLWFLWFLGAVLAGALLFLADIPRRAWRHLPLGALLLALGAAPLALSTFITRFAVLDFMKGADNTRYLSHLADRIRQVGTLLDGSWVADMQGLSAGAGPLLLWLFPLSAGWLLVSMATRREGVPRSREAIALLVAFAVLLAQSPFTITGRQPYQLFLLFVLAQLLTAIALFDLASLLRTRTCLLAALAAGFSLVLSSNLGSLIQYHRDLKRTGGKGHFSGAIFELADWFADDATLRPVVLDWGIGDSLIVLSDGRLAPKTFDYIERPQVKSGPEFAILKRGFLAELGEEFRLRNNIYIFRGPSHAIRDSFATFSELARSKGKRVRERRRFFQKNGEPLFIAYSVR